MYIYIHIYKHTHTHIYTYVYIIHPYVADIRGGNKTITPQYG